MTHFRVERDKEILYDVLLEVPSHGIHSPTNLHSFRAHISIIPTKCIMCTNIIYPLSTAATCVRCSLCAHRRCIHNDHVKCEHFLLGPRTRKSSKYKLSNSELSSIPSSWSVAGELIGDISSDSIALNKKIQVAHSIVVPIVATLNLKDAIDISNGIIAAPGSRDCLWRKSLRYIAKDFNLSRTLSIPSDPAALESFTLSMLNNIETFPGSVCHTLRAMYLEMKLDSDHNSLAHARECLDNISCSVLTVLPADVVQDKDRLLIVVNAVDRKVLGTNDGAMYEKVWNAAQRLESSADVKLLQKLRILRQQSTLPFLSNNDNDHNSNNNNTLGNYDEAEKGVELELSRVASALTAMDKLRHLVNALRGVASTVSHASKMNTNETTEIKHTSPISSPSKAPLVSTTSTSPSPEKLSTSPWENVRSVEDEMNTLQDMNVNADTLLQRFIAVLVGFGDLGDSDEQPVEVEDTQHLNEKEEDQKYDNHIDSGYFNSHLLIATGTNKSKCKPLWHAECNFIASLCRENDWLLGAEGYAMVTLQQALISICCDNENENEENNRNNRNDRITSDSICLKSDKNNTNILNNSNTIENNYNNSLKNSSSSSSKRKTEKTVAVVDTYSNNNLEVSIGDTLSTDTTSEKQASCSKFANKSKAVMTSPPLIQRRGEPAAAAVLTSNIIVTMNKQQQTKSSLIITDDARNVVLIPPTVVPFNSE